MTPRLLPTNSPRTNIVSIAANVCAFIVALLDGCLVFLGSMITRFRPFVCQEGVNMV
jgi:hypothetical protein